MKKGILILAAALLLTLVPSACAQSEIPQQILDLFEAQHGTDDFEGLYFFSTPDGSRLCVMYNATGWMNIFRSTDARRENWTTESQVSPVDGTWQIRFVRHDPLTPRADGSHYPDELGFDLVCEKTGRRLSYHYNGTNFVICGWKNPAEYQGEVILNGTRAAYYPAGKDAPAFVAALGTGLDSIMTSFDDLPFTPAAAKQMEAIPADAIRDKYPGYTLFSYAFEQYQTEAQAEYYKIEDGRLHVLRAVFHSAHQAPDAYACMPVPLSQGFLDRLQTESISDLLALRASENLFLTDGALNMEAVPVRGEIVHSHLQDRALILLTDENGKRYLHIVTEADGAYAVQTSRQLPNGAYLDIFHAGNGEVQLEWQEDGRYRTAGYTHRADGSWQLEWTMNSGEDAEDLGFVYCGVVWEHNGGSSNGVCFGSVSDLSLLHADLVKLPRNRQELTAFVDRSSWAAVNNPNPADRLHLRAEPSRDAKSLGKFYNRTPVKLLQHKGDWCRVQIGLDGYLTGWMMKKYLAFGDAMDAVDCAFPDKTFTEGHESCPLYDTMALKSQHSASGEYWIVGVVEDELYIIVTTNGESGYVPQEWFWEGNG